LSGGVPARRALVVVLVVVAVISVALALRQRPAPATGATGPGLGTPLWSVRRVPQPLVDGVGSQRLQAELATGAAGVDRCFAVEADGAGVVAEGDADRPLAPGSAVKLLTAAAALSTLGPGYHFETRAVAAAPVDAGTVDRLWLVGGGDPLLATPEYSDYLSTQALTRGDPVTPLAALADALVARGVRRIPGGITGDDSRYDRTRYLPFWPASYRAEPAIGPIGALTVDGGYTTFKGRKVAAPDPAALAAAELARLLVARGVGVGGSAPGNATAPANASVLATLSSPGLAEVVIELLNSSDNLTAEMLTRELGARLADSAGPGTTALGVKAIAAKLGQLGIPLTGLVLDDGSGLSRTNRVTCRLLLATLGLGARPELRSLWDGLAVAGTRGTLADDFTGSPLHGRLRAKTGTLAGVAALAGLIDAGRPLRFSFLFNGLFSDDRGRALRNQAATAAARFPDSPSPDALVPSPLPASAPGP
jgi:serine-type D-Ala-D-Ala carboxypeptidase/endopeptidase (penicillin-binding protein 4)